jgi:hypothetical protein
MSIRLDKEEHFKVKSPFHCRLFELYNAWIRITNSVMNYYRCPIKLSLRISWEIMSCKHGLYTCILGFRV